MARTAVSVWVLVMVVVVAGAMAAKPECHPESLTSCDSANKYGMWPSVSCCWNLLAQKRCICRYLNDPRYQRYIQGPFIKNTIPSCGIPLPHYCL
ncbi:hypothetical protein ZWY2020_012780 [Hordeum vulgare]|nr:hypothetical protein ZWY2020_012780 [Hordeum vulgare]